MNTLVKCRYGEEGLGPACCLVDDGQAQSHVRCAVYDWEECPFGKKVEGCGTCAHTSDMTLVDEARMVDCDANERQMYSPYATECKHWEKAVENRA